MLLRGDIDTEASLNSVDDDCPRTRGAEAESIGCTDCGLSSVAEARLSQSEDGKT